MTFIVPPCITIARFFGSVQITVFHRTGKRDPVILKKYLFIIIGSIILITLLAVTGAYNHLQTYAKTPADENPAVKMITVSRGSSFAQTAQTLYQAGIIKSPLKFRILARMRRVEKRIQAGEYLLAPSMPPGVILEKMVTGKVRLYKMTVPEGSNLKEIAGIIAQAGFVNSEDFMKIATDPAEVGKLGIEAATLEGYLFPDTYYFPKSATARDIIEAMVERFRSLFSDEWKNRAAEMGFTIHEVLTMAAIIEKETGAAAERPLISSVFHNRLRKGMRLETDPTVIYGIENFDGNLTRSHLRTYTPYNTYKIKGLPPGPIASPGLASIEAALYPAKTDYLFFVSKQDGTHHFSSKFWDHRRAIRKYQLRRKR